MTGHAPALVHAALAFALAPAPFGDRRARAFARVLAARHLVQAAAIEGRGARAQAAGAGVDLLHAASVAALAWRDRRHRRALVASAAVAVTLAGFELRVARRMSAA